MKPEQTSDISIDALRGELKNVKLIGKGGMSLVFRAWQPSLERFVVIKRLKDELLQSPETVERFRREALALASVLHQNIAHVYDYVERPGEAFILMEYIDGVDLSLVIEKTDFIPPEIAACVLLEVAKGLGYIHERGLIHRDVKPSNIRLSNRGEVKLMDFGIVLQVENTSLTRPGVMVGSPSYLSPEQIIGDKVTDRADIFLLGIVLYEMLTGTRPFKEQEGESIYQRIRESRYVEIRKMEPSVPKALERVVEKSLRKEPARRYQKVESLITELEAFLGPTISSNPQKYIVRFLEEQGVLKPAVAFERFPTSDESAAHRRWLRHWRLVGALGISLIMFAGGFWIAKRVYSEPQGMVAPTTQFAKPKPIPAKR